MRKEMIEMKVSDCCGVPSQSNGEVSSQDFNMCPKCHAECRYVEPAPVAVAAVEDSSYPGQYWQPLFDLMSNEHGLTLLDSELNDIANCVRKMEASTTPQQESKGVDEVERLKAETKAANKEVQAIKNYISELRKEALKKHSDNTGVLVFIQKLEESFTWVRDI